MAGWIRYLGTTGRHDLMGYGKCCEHSQLRVTRKQDRRRSQEPSRAWPQLLNFPTSGRLHGLWTAAGGQAFSTMLTRRCAIQTDGRHLGTEDNPSWAD